MEVRIGKHGRHINTNNIKQCSFNDHTPSTGVLSPDGINMDPQHWSRVTARGPPQNPSLRPAIVRRCRLGLFQPQQSLCYSWSRPHTGSMCRDSTCTFKEWVKYFKIIVLKKIDGKTRHDKTISLSWTLYLNVLPKQRHTDKVNHGFHGQRPKLRCSKAVPVKIFFGHLILLCACWHCRTRPNNPNFQPPSAPSSSSMATNHKILPRCQQLFPGLATHLPMHAISSSASPLHCPHAVFYAQDLRAMRRRLPVGPHYCKSRDR